jgi:hypothetical protein
MRRLILAAATAFAMTMPAAADPWKDESGHGRWRHGDGEWKEEYRDGDCKIERKWERGGEYKEEVECDGHYGGYLAPPVIVGQAPVTGTVDLPPLPDGLDYGDLYRDGAGRYCREYQTTGIIDGRRERLYGTACLQPDGDWIFND